MKEKNPEGEYFLRRREYMLHGKRITLIPTISVDEKTLLQVGHFCVFLINFTAIVIIY